MGVNADNVSHTRQMVASLEQRVLLEKILGIGRGDKDWGLKPGPLDQ